MTGLPSFFENFFYSLVYKRALSVLIGERQIFPTELAAVTIVSPEHKERV